MRNTVPSNINTALQFFYPDSKNDSQCRFVLGLDKNKALPEEFCGLTDEDKYALLNTRWDSGDLPIRQIAKFKPEHLSQVVSSIKSPKKQLDLLCDTGRLMRASDPMQSTFKKLVEKIFKDFSKDDVLEFENNIYLKHTTAHNITDWLTLYDPTLFFDLFAQLNQEQIFTINRFIIRKVAGNFPEMVWQFLKPVGNKLCRLQLLFGQLSYARPSMPLIAELIQEALTEISIEEKNDFVAHHDTHTIAELIQYFPQLIPDLLEGLSDEKIVSLLNVTNDDNQTIVFILAERNPDVLVSVLKQIKEPQLCLKILFGLESLYQDDYLMPYDVFVKKAQDKNKQNLEDVIEKALSETDEMARESIFTTPNSDGVTGVMRLALNSPLLLIPLFQKFSKEKITQILMEKDTNDFPALKLVKEHYPEQYVKIASLGDLELILKKETHSLVRSNIIPIVSPIQINKNKPTSSEELGELRKEFDTLNVKKNYFFQYLLDTIRLCKKLKDFPKLSANWIEEFKGILNNPETLWPDTYDFLRLLVTFYPQGLLPLLLSIEDPLLRLEILFYSENGGENAYFTFNDYIEGTIKSTLLEQLNLLIVDALNNISPKDKWRILIRPQTKLHLQMIDRKGEHSFSQALFNGLSEDKIYQLWCMRNSDGQRMIDNFVNIHAQFFPRVLNTLSNPTLIFNLIFDSRDKKGSNVWDILSSHPRFSSCKEDFNAITTEVFKKIDPNLKYQWCKQNTKNEEIIYYFIQHEPDLFFAFLTNMTQDQKFDLLQRSRLILTPYNLIPADRFKEQLEILFNNHLDSPELQVKLMIEMEYSLKDEFYFEEKLLALSPEKRFFFLSQSSIITPSLERLSKIFDGMSNENILQLLNDELSAIHRILVKNPNELKDYLKLTNDTLFQFKILFGLLKSYNKLEGAHKNELLELTLDYLLTIGDAPIDLYPQLVFIGKSDLLKKNLADYFVSNIHHYANYKNVFQSTSTAIGIVFNFHKSSNSVVLDTTSSAEKINQAFKDLESDINYLDPSIQPNASHYPFWKACNADKNSNGEHEYKELSEFNSSVSGDFK